MRCITSRRSAVAALALAAPLAIFGCFRTAPDYSTLAQGPAPLRTPSPERVAAASESYEDSLTGAQVYSMYCAQCHNPRPLSERPFSNFKNVAVHMTVRANLTGKESAKLIEFLHRFHDVPPPTPPIPPSPKRLTFGQPVSELRDQDTPPRSLGNPGLAPADARPASPPSDQQPAAVVPAAAGGTADPRRP
jgi:hypothetical protein